MANLVVLIVWLRLPFYYRRLRYRTRRPPERRRAGGVGYGTTAAAVNPGRALKAE